MRELRKGVSLHERALKVMNPRAQSYFDVHAPETFPRYIVKAKGPYVWDVDGNRYIDLFLGSGAIILGHSDDQQLEAIRRQFEMGTIPSLRHPMEVELAEWICQRLKFAERVSYFKTGSEAVHAAIGMALEAKKRPFIMKLGYHGWLPPFSRGWTCNVQAINADWNISDVNRILEEQGEEIAAIIASPNVSQTNPEFYHYLQKAAHDHDALFIFDEIKSACRLGFPTYSNEIGLEPDICLLGKAISNGFPLAVLTSKHDSYENYEYFSTFAGEPISLVAAEKTLQILDEGAYSDFEQQSTALYQKLSIELEAEISVVGYPTFFRLTFPSEKYGLMATGKLALAGILLHPLDELLLSASHTNGIIQEIARSIQQVAENLDGDMENES